MYPRRSNLGGPGMPIERVARNRSTGLSFSAIPLADARAFELTLKLKYYFSNLKMSFSSQTLFVVQKMTTK